MPVKLKSESNSSDAMSISLDEYNQGRANFKAHYYRTGCNPSIGGQDLQIPWVQLYNAVQTFIQTTYMTSVGVRIVYCYDVTTNALNLRIQLCSMAQTPQAQTTNTFALITTQCAWYKIQNGGLVTALDTNLYDTPYLTNLCYCPAPPCNGTNCIPLSTDTQSQNYARTITFPWQEEILQMYLDNGSPQGASICFGATSYTHANSGDSNIAFPHGIVMYLKGVDGKAMLNNDQDTISIFHNKGADYGTLCPKYCNVYVFPPNVSCPDPE